MSWHTTRAVANDRVGGWGYKCEHRGFTTSPIDTPKYEGIDPRMAEKQGNRVQRGLALIAENEVLGHS